MSRDINLFLKSEIKEDLTVDMVFQGKEFIKFQPILFEELQDFIDELLTRTKSIRCVVDLKGANLTHLDVWAAVRLICKLEEYTRGNDSLKKIHFIHGGFLFKWIWRVTKLALPEYVRNIVIIS